LKLRKERKFKLIRRELKEKQLVNQLKLKLTIRPNQLLEERNQQLKERNDKYLNSFKKID
jgi:hypothetical protein